jgi:hypothetical protein
LLDANASVRWASPSKRTDPRRNRLQSTPLPFAFTPIVMRCRLHFLLHELDLPLGVTTIGRSVDCHVTLDDPLVSRRHVRIVVGSDRVVIEDTDSQNGVFVNGVALRGLTQLLEGDRVRVGAQEFVFHDHGVADTPLPRRDTGALRLCAACRMPYPREVMSCPSCEETEQVDEDTLTDAGSPGRSSLELLVEGLERALAVGRVGDAQRLARRTSEQVAQLVVAGVSVDAELLVALAAQAAELTAASHDPSWALWALDVFRDARQVPPVDVVERLAEVGKAAARRPRAQGDAR